MNKKITAIFAVLLILLASMTAYANIFSDIENHSAADYIIEFSNNGYINGYTDRTFRPDNPITRAEFSSILSKFGQSAGIEYMEFSDVEYTDWFFTVVQNAVSRGFVTGYTDDTFRPDNNISRYEVVKIVSQMIRYDNYVSVQLPYSDAYAIPAWATNYVRNLYGAEIIGVYPDNTLNGEIAATRAEAVTMLTKVMRKYNWSQDMVSAITLNNAYNPLPIPSEMPYEIIGYLSIPSIGLKENPCRDGATLENMKISIAHYAETSIWDGNIGLCAHNRDYTYDFRNLQNVNIGDKVIYRTRFGERHYRVTEKLEIADDDWSYLGKYSEVNKITMTTCISGVAEKRLCVQAVEVVE